MEYTKSEFEILSYAQEKQFSNQEKKAYFLKLHELLKYSSYAGWNSIQVKFYELLNRYFWKKVLRIIRKYELYVDGLENIPKSPVIYAFHHAGVLDSESAIEALPEHAVLLAGDDVDKMTKFLLSLNMTVFVNRQDKQSRFDSKIELIKALAKGKSVMLFPEATWNLSPNKIHLPITWGIIDIAKKMDVPIVPAVIEYDYDNRVKGGKGRINHIHVRYGKPVFVDALDDMEEKYAELEEKFSTVRFSVWEQKGIHRRSDIDMWEYQNFITQKLNSFPMLDMNQENNCIFGSSDEFYQYFYIKEVPCDAWGNLLQTQKVRQMNDVWMGKG